MRALVIDDEQLVLEGLEALLQAMLPDLSLDKTADVNAATLLAASVRYELILLDWHLRGAAGEPVDGRSIVQAVRAAGSTAPILVVSGDDRHDWPQLLQEMGLSGMVPKCASGTQLIDAIQVATRGGIYLPAWPLGEASSSWRQPAPPQRALSPRERFPELTARQAEVFEVMIRGLGDKQIARELGISEATVKTHVRGILAVVGVNRRGEAVFEATAAGGKNA